MPATAAVQLLREELHLPGIAGPAMIARINQWSHQRDNSVIPQLWQATAEFFRDDRDTGRKGIVSLQIGEPT
jgi:hypothetical protein